MAEFCVECWIEIFARNDSPDEYAVTNYLDLCEGCGECKPVVIGKKKDIARRRIRRIFFPIRIILTTIYVLWRLLIFPYLIIRYLINKNR